MSFVNSRDYAIEMYTRQRVEEATPVTDVSHLLPAPLVLSNSPQRRTYRRLSSASASNEDTDSDDASKTVTPTHVITPRSILRSPGSLSSQRRPGLHIRFIDPSLSHDSSSVSSSLSSSLLAGIPATTFDKNGYRTACGDDDDTDTNDFTDVQTYQHDAREGVGLDVDLSDSNSHDDDAAEGSLCDEPMLNYGAARRAVWPRNDEHDAALDEQRSGHLRLSSRGEKEEEETEVYTCTTDVMHSGDSSTLPCSEGDEKDLLSALPDAGDDDGDGVGVVTQRSAVKSRKNGDALQHRVREDGHAFVVPLAQDSLEDVRSIRAVSEEARATILNTLEEEEEERRVHTHAGEGGATATNAVEVDSRLDEITATAQSSTTVKAIVSNTDVSHVTNHHNEETDAVANDEAATNTADESVHRGEGRHRDTPSRHHRHRHHRHSPHHHRPRRDASAHYNEPASIAHRPSKHRLHRTHSRHRHDAKKGHHRTNGSIRRGRAGAAAVRLS